MRYPHAHSGVKKLFICELIAIIASTLAVVGSILAAIGLKKDALLLTGGSLLLASGIALVVVFILQLVGLHQAGKDETQIKYAFYLTILGIVLGVVSAILGSLTKSKGIEIAQAFVEAAETVATLLASYYVLAGIASLANKLGDKAMAKRGKALANWVIIFFLVSTVFDLFGVILKTYPAEWLTVVAVILAIVAEIAKLIVYIITFLYYAKAVKMLKE